MSIDQLGRRSRFQKTPTGKRIDLTERDLTILSWLCRYRYLSARQLVRLIAPKSEKRFIERLGDLYHETGLINRPKAQWNDPKALSNRNVYEISKSGIEHLKNRHYLPLRATTLSRRQRRGVSSQYGHAMLICTKLVEIELQCLHSEHERFICVDEILRRAPASTRDAPNPLAIPVTLRPSAAFPELMHRWDTHVIPDALYGIERTVDGERLYKFWALECERTSPKSRQLNLSSRDKKELVYKFLIRSGLHQQHFGIPNLTFQIAT